ncbi:MAG: tyrosine-type recombinase/integrase [Pyrinomonadaceae bacterium]
MAVFKREFIKKYNRKVWGYIGYIDGRQRRKFGFSSEEKAQTAFYSARTRAQERRSGVLPDTDAQSVTVEQIIRARIKQLPVPKGSPGYYSRNQAVGDLERFLAMLPHGLLVAQLTAAHGAAYRDARLEAGLAPQTVFREYTNIQACFNAAGESFPQLENWRPPKRPKIKVPKSSRNRTVTPEEAALLLADLRRPREAAHERYGREPERAYRARLDAADFLQLSLQTAMRPDETVRRSWTDVLWHSSRLLVDSTKTDEEGTIDLPASCLEMLRRRHAEQHRKSPWLFPSDVVPGQHIARAPTALIRRAAEKLGIPWGYETRGGIVLYTTRHTAATAMLQAGHDLATVQAQTRHSTKTMLMRYAHASARSRRAAASALDAFGDNSCSGSCVTGGPDKPRMPRKPRAKEKAKGAKRGGNS